MEIWISSDLHLWHENIIRYCSRPFKDGHEMTELLIQWHNELVKPEDHWYHLGDLTMLRGSLGSSQAHRTIAAVRRMHGHKRTLLGNHDHFPPKVYLECGFEKIVGTGQWLDDMILSHYPVHPTSLARSRGCVHGHTHDNPDEPVHAWVDKNGKQYVQPFLNVCVERTNYRPLPLYQVKAMVTRLAENWKETNEGIQARA